VSHAVRQELARRNPADSEAQAALASANNKLVVLLYKIGDVRGSLEYSRREVQIYRDLVAREPQQMQWKPRLSNSVSFMARRLTNTGEAGAARALWQEALATNRELAKHDPTNVDWQRNVALTLNALGNNHEHSGEAAVARAMYVEAVTIIEEIVKKAPSRPGFVIDAMSFKADYGRLLAESGDPYGVTVLRDALRRLESLKADRGARYYVARTSLILGEVLNARDPAAAIAFETAERELAPLIAATSNPDELALWTRVLIHRQRLDEARAMLARLRPTGYATAQLEQLIFAKGS
jgi:tetratricopeptide (TPR) repeat protein